MDAIVSEYGPACIELLRLMEKPCFRHCGIANEHEELLHLYDQTPETEEDIEELPETLPPYGWYSGQMKTSDVRPKELVETLPPYGWYAGDIPRIKRHCRGIGPDVSCVTNTFELPALFAEKLWSEQKRLPAQPDKL